MFSSLASLALALLAQAFTHVGPTPPPHGYPEIRSAWISTTDPHAGQTVYGKVETSANVPYVEARVTNYNVALKRDGDGRFSLTYKVPWWLPPWLRRAWDLQVIARSVDGVETTKIIPIRLH